jgi:TP901 family phage tail tape measure protein
MADETISTRIVANADFSALIADVHKVTASLSQLQEKLANSNKMLANNIAVINRSFSDTLRSTGQFSTHFVSLTSDVEKFGKNLDGGKLKLRDYFNTFQTHAKTSGGLIRDLARQQVAMQNAVLQPLGRNAEGLMQFNVHVPRGLDAVKNKTAIARQELAIMNKVIQDGAGQLINWGKNTQWAGRQLTVGLTVPMAAFGKAAADAFRVADQELTRLTKVYGDIAGTSASELSRVREEVIATSKELSSAYGTNFSETIGLAADIAATGKQGQELLDSVKETSRLAVLGEVDRQEAMKATLAIQSAFKANTDELAQSINFLNAVENQTSTTLNDLVEAIPKAGPVIKGLGGSVQDLALYLTAMREGGVSASEGANALKSALASLINPTDVAVAKFQGFGIDILGIVNNNAGNVTATLMALQAALDNLDPLQKQQAIEQLFGKFQFSRLNALFENLGRQGSQTLQVLDLMKASAGDLEAVAARELTAVTESASGKYRRALESLKADLAGLGDEFLTISTNIIKIVDKALEFFSNLPKPIKQALTFLGALTAVAGPLIMLTGVLANFFGYILKGIGHMKAFFKGGEGWKYLTPEMLAAEKAGKLVEQTFYSDAKAAAILQTALRNLIDEFSILEAKARSGAVSVGPAVSTMAGNLVMGAGGGRVVNPSHPLVGPMGTRASTHMVPRGGMTDEQKLQQTIFGLVPGSVPVNRKIGEAPQIYMTERLPDVPGLTTAGGVSTGVVAGEAARWHAMTATLAMQSKQEIEMLKKQIATTGVVTKDFMNQFDDMLPVVSKITDNAAKESALIVAEMRAGKLTVEQAKAKIIALNLEIERMIASSVQSQAATMGRTINPTMVPTLNQPVVDPTGKSNMRELFKKSKTRDLIDKVARSLGVRTSGAGYNIETTRPRKMNMGGYVYTMNDGNIVPGPDVNRDVVPAMLTPGEFVVNREATARNLPLLQSINSQRNSELPIGFMPPSISDSILGIFGQRRGSRGSASPGNLLGRWGMIMPQGINDDLAQKLNSPGALGSDLIALLQEPDRLIDLEDFLSFNGVDPKDIDRVKRQVASDMAARIVPQAYYADGGFGQIAMSSTQRAVTSLENRYPGISLSFQRDRMTPGRRDTLRRPRAGETQEQANRRGGGSPTGINYKGQRPSNYGAGASRGSVFGPRQVWGHFADQEFQKNTSLLSRALGFARRTPNLMAIKNPGPSRAMSFIPGLFRNSGGMIPGYNMGGMVMPQSVPIPAQNGKYNMGGMVQGYNRGGIISEAREKGFFGFGRRGGGGMMSSPMAGIGMGMGLQMAGQAIGGGAGMALQAASVISMIAPSGFGKLLGLIPKIISGFTSFSKIVTVVRGGLVLLTRAIPGAAVLAGIFGIVKAFQAWRKSIADAKRDATALNGITEKGAKEAGIQYTTLTDRVKALKEEQKLAADKARAYFESYASAGGAGGLTLTIKQLKELKERVKADMPETLAILNNIDSSKVNQWASNLKAQMVASGKSVEEATNLIYALIESSNKAGMGVRALTDKAFTGITDKGSAASFIMETLAKNIRDVSQIDPSAFASNVDTAVSSLDSAVQSLIGTKNATGQTIDEAEALAIQFDKMTKSGIKNNKLGEDALKALKAQRPEFAAILNSSDTIGGMYAKWRLLLQGVNIDLSKISSSQAETLVKFTAALDAAGRAGLAGDQRISALNATGAVIKELEEDYKELQKAANSDSISRKGLDKAEIKAIQDKIKNIRDLAAARKKALRETFDQENAAIELQQAQIELQAAVARGDASATAQAQLRIQQIQKEIGLKQAEAKIEENAQKAEERQQAILDKDAAYKDKLIDAANGAAKAADNLNTKIKTLKELEATLVDIASKRAIGQDINMDLQNFLNSLQVSAKTDPKVIEAFKKFFVLDSKGNATKDKQGNFIMQKANEAYSGIPLKPGVTIPQGGALSEIDRIANQMSTYATEITGGVTLKQIGDILLKGQVPKTGEKGAVKVNTSTYSVRGTTVTSNLVSPTDLYNAGISTQPGTTFTDNKGVKWKISGPATAGSGYQLPVTKAKRGGVASSGQPIIVGDGGRPELFIPKTDGIILPNLNNIPDLGPKFNIPQDGSYRSPQGISNSYNNNTYNIDIALSGTNVTADDIIKKFRSELALISAKEGRSRSFGGNY